MPLLLTITESIGWLVFIYMGGAGVYEMLGGRKVRATSFLAGAFGWIVVTFVVMWVTRLGGTVLGTILALAYLAATGWLVYKVSRLLGKPDMDIR